MTGTGGQEIVVADGSSALPLSGVTVLDATHVLAGSFATYQLALLGADVVRVERPAGDDFVRHHGGTARMKAHGLGASFLSDADPMFSPMSEHMEASFRRMLDDEAAIRPLRTPEAAAERRALYDRLEAELVEKGAVAEPVKPDHIARLESELMAASDRAAARDAALAAAPVLTFEDAARKLQHALHRMDGGDRTIDQLVASALEGLRRLAGTA